jgi:hydrogenase maturation protein HypF
MTKSRTNAPAHPPARPLRRWRITVRGVVQGVGFRPFVYRAARTELLGGWVLNEADAVRIEVQGEVAALDRFLHALRHELPPQARVDTLETSEVPVEPHGGLAAGFEIRTSSAQSAPRPAIPADLAVCSQCVQEIFDSRQRRYRYPFTNCTNCGPRWSIIQHLPYDRSRTSMHGFRMCGECRAEYEDPGDRRFHAQPIACPACGPELVLWEAAGGETARGDAALRAAAEQVCAGRILALQGLGGFQLIVDATSQQAVQRLRDRKRRPDKPLAILAASLEEIRQRCRVSEAEAAALQSPAAPILLLARRTDAAARDDIAAAVAPDNPQLGVMLPCTPLHHLLLAEIARPLICTSGNLSEEPMAITLDDARERLGAIADLLLVHNRPIVRPVDDSVARVVAPGQLQVLRRARGYAPLPIRLKCELPTILAVGSHLKNTVALSLGDSVVLTPHIGDLDTALSLEVHGRAIADLVQFFAVVPAAVTCDLHPDYASTRHAERLAASWGVPLISVQHHQAHVAACMAEHGLEGPVLGLAWDGTGYGTDRTVWGGEALRCEGAACQRIAHVRTFPLPGGDRAAREPRRSALGLLYEILGAAATEVVGQWFTAAELSMLYAALSRPKLFPRTSSLGRLFDAVAALCGLPASVTFEGQAAMALEFAAWPAVTGRYPLPATGCEPLVWDWEPLIRAILADRRSGRPVGEIAASFHNSLAAAAVAAARTAACPQIVLTGGCFQNALLTERVRQELQAAGFDVFLHQAIPPGDGGIALGQILVAAARMKAEG